MDKYIKNEIDEINEFFEEDQSGFEIKDKASADWVLRKIRALNQEINETKALADREIERVKEWEEKETKSSKSNVEFFEGLIDKYMIKSRTFDPEFRKISLPSGLVRYQKQQDRWDFDETKTIKYLADHYPDKLDVAVKFSKADLKKHVKETGEIWDGLKIVEQPEKIVIKIEEVAKDGK